MADPKQAIMDQVRQQAALSNARALIDVSAERNQIILAHNPPSLTCERTESQRTLLRALRPQTRLLPLLLGNDVLYLLHG